MSSLLNIDLECEAALIALILVVLQPRFSQFVPLASPMDHLHLLVCSSVSVLHIIPLTIHK